jgi:non-ribosomal peptide synthetase component F
MQINVIDVTPSTALLIQPGTVPCLRRMTVAGELINPALIPLWVDELQLLNAYGLSENTQVNWRREMLVGQNPQNIGRPSDTTTSFVLMPGTTQLSPLLVPGELCLGGDQLAVHYINRPEKTAESFIPNPFGPGRLYRTGDMVVAQEDGSIEMLGRIDFQVKINGQRVEPGDSNTIIQTHPDVHTSSVVSAEVDDRRVLIAVVIPKAGIEWRKVRRELKDLLKLHIPSYMMPSYWLPETELPLNVNGKVDIVALSRYVQGLGRDLLLELSSEGIPRGRMTGPFSPAALKLRNIWASILHLPSDRISGGDFFLELGGSSLDAIRVLAKAFEMGLKVSVADVLGLPLHEIANHDRNEKQISDVIPFSLLPKNSKLARRGLEDAFPVTPLQAVFLADSLLGNSTYVYRRYYRIIGYDANELRAGLQHMAHHHPTLRTTFFPDKTSFLQATRESVDLSWECLDMTAEEFSSKPKHKMQLGKSFVHFSILRSSVLAVSMHHALFDFWSNSFLVDDLASILQGQIPVHRPSLSKFIEHTQSQDQLELKGFWQSKLKNAVPSLLGHQTGTNSVVRREVSGGLYTFATSHKVSVGSLIYASWAIVLSLHTSQNEVIFGTTLSGRDAAISRVLDIAGPTINTIPFRILVNSHISLLEFAKLIQEEIWRHSNPSLLGIRAIMHAAGLKGDLYDTLVNILIKGTSQVHGEAVNKILVPCLPEEPNFLDSTLLEAELGSENIQIRLLSCLEERRASLILGNVVETLNTFISQPDSLIADINPITAEEVAYVKSISTESPTAQGLLAHSLIEKISARLPNKKALHDISGKTFSYREFDQAATRLSKVLISKGATTGSIIPLIMQKSPSTLIAILGVLKAGAAFTPLDPKNHRDRNYFIMEDVNAKLVITNSTHTDALDDFPGEIIKMDKLDELVGYTEHAPVQIRPEDLAYVIYTSGSTGLPKGVEVSHGAIAASSEGMIEACKVDQDWHVLWCLNYVFDASYFDVFTVLGSGGTICIADQDTLINNLAECVKTFGVKQLMITPSISKLISPSEVPTIQTLLVCGEPITPELVSTWASRIDVYNGYGMSPLSRSMHLAPSNLHRANRGYHPYDGFQSTARG